MLPGKLAFPLRSALLVLLLGMLSAQGRAGVDLTSFQTEAAVDAEIARLQARPDPLGPRDHYQLGALYYIKRDFAPDLYTRNKLAIESGKHFFAYKQEHALGAQKNIALFCIDRIRHAPSVNRPPGEDVDRCSVIVSSYFAADGKVKPDFTMDEVILEAMADELLYDVAHRHMHWRAADIISLVEALEQARLARKQPAEVDQALIDNLAHRLSEPVEGGDLSQARAVYLEGFRLMDFALKRDLGPDDRERLLALREQAQATEGGQSALSLGMLDTSTELLEKARNSVSAYRILRGSLPGNLDATTFQNQELPEFIAAVAIRGESLVLRYSADPGVPEPLRSKNLVWQLEKSGRTVKSSCSPRTTVADASLRDALGCPAAR